MVRACGCVACQAGDHPHREDHRQLNVLLSRLDEQRRWVEGREAARLGHGGIQQIAEITRLASGNDSAGRDELVDDLRGRPTEQVRLPGGGRPRVEKKILC